MTNQRLNKQKLSNTTSTLLYIIYKENNLIMYRKDNIHFLHAMPMFKFTG